MGDGSMQHSSRLRVGCPPVPMPCWKQKVGWCGNRPERTVLWTRPVPRCLGRCLGRANPKSYVWACVRHSCTYELVRPTTAAPSIAVSVAVCCLPPVRPGTPSPLPLALLHDTWAHRHVLGDLGGHFAAWHDLRYYVVRLHSRGSAHELILSLVRPADTRCRFDDCANLVDRPVCPSSHWSRTGNISTGGSPAEGPAAPFPLKWNFSQGQGPIRTKTFELATHVMQREPSQRYVLCHDMENGILGERGGQRVWASSRSPVNRPIRGARIFGSWSSCPPKPEGRQDLSTTDGNNMLCTGTSAAVRPRRHQRLPTITANRKSSAHAVPFQQPG